MMKISPGSEQWRPTSGAFPDEVVRAGYFDELWQVAIIAEP
jgi:hypothetical protein